MIAFGIDIGTTTLRTIATEIAFNQFGNREVSVLSENCTFTPYDEIGNLVESDILTFLDEWQKTLKIKDPEVGTLLFTGEAQRSQNCLSVLKAIHFRWPGLLSAQLNPQVESRLAAQGAGAVEFSVKHPGKVVLHIDIGGGTSNMALIKAGEILDTACLDLGARKWILDPTTGKVLRKTKGGKLLETNYPLLKHDIFNADLSQEWAEIISRLILNPQSTDPYWINHWKSDLITPDIFSISGGVADALQASCHLQFGDIGPFLARALKRTADNLGMAIRFADHTGRATALGVSAFGFQVSGISVHGKLSEQTLGLPLFTAEEWQECGNEQAAVYLPHPAHQLDELIRLCSQWQTLPQVFLLKENVGKAFGYLMSKRFKNAAFVAIDEIKLEDCEPNQLRTVDIRIHTETGRYLVTIKILQQF